MFIKKIKNFYKYSILFLLIILTNNARAEFFEDLSKIIENNEKKLIISYEKNVINIQEIIDVIKSQKIDIFDVQSRDPDLEDVFIKLIKN